MTPRCRPQSCIGCSLYGKGTDFSQPEGTGSLGVAVIAEASGDNEARDQLPLRPYAPSGGVLERTFRRMGLSREQFVLTNIIRCQPPRNFLVNAPWEYSAINHCRPNLDKVLADHKPRAIFALGDTALRELTGEAGEARTVSHLRGFVIRGPNGVPVVPTYHPAFLRRGKMSYAGLFARDLQRAVNVAAGRDKQYIWDLEEARCNGTIKYQTHPSIDDARAFRNLVLGNRDLVLSYDLETYESASLDEDARDGFQDTRIRLVQFSVAAGSGIAMPWSNGYREIVADILHAPNLKVGHNIWLFDNKVLRAVGEREGIDLTPRGTCHDTLAMFHHWQPDLPAHLQFAASFANFPFPWKHLAGTDLELYGCVDVDATWRLYAMLRATMERDGIWGDATRGYVGQVYSVRPVLAAMEDRGLPVDDAAREKLGEEFDHEQQRLTAELDARFPDDARSIHPKEGYKKVPKSTDGLVMRDFTIPSLDEATGEPIISTVARWCRLEPFSPNSGPQLIRYMKSKGHKVPKSKEEREDGTAKDTTSKKELVRLAAKVHDDFYLKVIECRELGKARGTYIEGFKPHADGRVHTTFTFDTGIGQLSSRNPNVQNFPKHGNLAKVTRRMVAAEPGHILTEWDFKSCHVLTLGYLANDPNYIRTARIDQHSIMTGHFLKLWRVQDILKESDDEIKARCKWLKANPEWKHIRDAKVKHAGLGIGNGLKEKGLYERYMEFFASQKEARNILACYEEVYPMVFAWQKRMQRLAHEQTYLKTEYGHIRRFYEVFRWDSRKGDWGHGDQAEAAISFWLSNIAFGYIREKLKELHRLGLDERYGLCNNVHDSFVFHCPEALLAEHLREVQPVLVAPSPVLCGPAAPNGLWIAVDCAVGRDWSAMEEVKLPKVVEGHVVLEQEAMA